jgi:hypothetical protein
MFSRMDILLSERRRKCSIWYSPRNQVEVVYAMWQYQLIRNPPAMAHLGISVVDRCL